MKFKIDRYLIDDILNSEHPSDFEALQNYAVLILRLPYIDENRVKVVSYAFYIEGDRVYHYCRQKRDFILLGNFNALHTYLDRRIDKILAKINRLQANIEKLEDRLYQEDLDSKFPKEWLMMKKELALIERLMSHAIIAFSRFIKHFRSSIEELAYKDLQEHIERAFSYAKSLIEKLDNIYNFYRMQHDEKMNRIMFMLTIISAIFLPMTLITGYFGMNTGGLPLTEDPLGTLKVTLLLLLFEVPFVYLVWRMLRH